MPLTRTIFNKTRLLQFLLLILFYSVGYWSGSQVQLETHCKQQSPQKITQHNNLVSEEQTQDIVNQLKDGIQRNRQDEDEQKRIIIEENKNVVSLNAEMSNNGNTDSLPTERKKLKIYIVSHRRSGTHLTMTTIANNFENVEVIKQEDHPVCDEESMGCERLETMLNTGKIVHAYRDVKDVLVSIYFYKEHIRKKFNQPSNNLTFSHYLLQKNSYSSTFYHKMNKVEFWRYHLESWMAIPNILHLSFEDSVSKPEEILLKLEEYLQIPLRSNRKPPEEWDKGQTVFFRNGKAGDWVNHFSKSDEHWVEQELIKPLNFTPIQCSFLE